MATDPATNTPYDPEKVILYRRNRFQSRLPKGRRYTASHFWLDEEEPGLWRVGFTRFATRMLGDIVEQGFEAKVGRHVKVGQTIGWVEGFKALTELYSVADGTFEGGNPELGRRPLAHRQRPIRQGVALPRPRHAGTQQRCRRRVYRDTGRHHR